MKSEPICPYCGERAVLVFGTKIYRHREDLHDKNFWLCVPCGAYVGCHPNTTRPLGRLANAELRAAKMAAHAAFDPAWKSGRLSRREAYRSLAKRLGLPESKCHIGMFDVEMCRKVVEVSSSTGWEGE